MSRSKVGKKKNNSLLEKGILVPLELRRDYKAMGKKALNVLSKKPKKKKRSNAEVCEFFYEALNEVLKEDGVRYVKSKCE